MAFGNSARGDGKRKMDPAERARFEQLTLPHLDRLHRFACQLSRNSTDADDLVQETFVRAFRGFGNFELREHGVRPWLMRILHNVYYSSIKEKHRQVLTLAHDIGFENAADELTDIPSEPLTVENLCWDHFDEELKQAVQELLVEYRTVLLLWAIDGLSYNEIAQVCGCPVGTVMSRLYRARQFLGRRLRTYARDRRLNNERNLA